MNLLFTTILLLTAFLLPINARHPDTQGGCPHGKCGPRTRQSLYNPYPSFCDHESVRNRHLNSISPLQMLINRTGILLPGHRRTNRLFQEPALRPQEVALCGG